MKTKADGVRRAFDPYTQKEIELILSLVPNKTNTINLADSLGRSPEAIRTIYHFAYSGKWLKNVLAEIKDNQDNVATKVAKAKTKLGIFIGHEPT